MIHSYTYNIPDVNIVIVPPMAHLLNKFCFLIPKQASGKLR